MNESAPIQLVPSKTDQQLANEFRDKMVQLLEPIMTLFDDIEAAGFGCGYDCGKDYKDKHIVTKINIVKKL